MKECRKCRVTKEDTEFNKAAKRKDGLQSYCRACSNSTSTQFAKDNKDKNRAACQRHRQKTYEFIREDKQSKGCACCGIKDWRVLDYDHLDRETKEFTIGSSPYGVSRKRLVAEIAKCQVLCANCHRIKTYENKETMRRDLLH